MGNRARPLDPGEGGTHHRGSHGYTKSRLYQVFQEPIPGLCQGSLGSSGGCKAQSAGAVPSALGWMASSAICFLLTLCPEWCPIRHEISGPPLDVCLLSEALLCCVIAQSIRIPGVGGGQIDRSTTLDPVWAFSLWSQVSKTSTSLTTPW